MADSPEKPRASIDTLAVHAGEPRRREHHELTTPVSLTATYTFVNTAEIEDHFEDRLHHHEYGRYGNPTVSAAEEKIAALDGAEAACLFASGMAALTTTLLALLQQGQHVILSEDCYRRTRQFITRVLSRYGVEHTLIPAGHYAALEAAIRPKQTRLILAESPTNPHLYVSDLRQIADIARRHRVKTFIDSTFATPVNQRPLSLGIDLVLHSATKYLAGHNDILAGSVSGDAGLVSLVRDLRGVLGGVLDAHAAYLLIRGIKTLPIRVRRQNETALRLARFLEGHERVRCVYYPGLASHPQHTIALEQMSGFGGVLSFEVAGDLAAASRFIDACRVPRIAPSLGGVESLIEQPALMSYYELSTEERQAVGLSESLIRMSVGLEAAEDLEADLAQALAAM